MKARTDRLIIIGVFLVILILAGITLWSIVYDPQDNVDCEIITAKVVRFDNELNVLLVQKENYVFEVRLSRELVILGQDGREIRASELLPGQRVRLSNKLHPNPLEPPRSLEANSTILYCIKIEAIS